MKSIFQIEQEIDELEDEESEMAPELMLMRTITINKVITEYLDRLRFSSIPRKLVKGSQTFSFVKSIIRDCSNDFRTSSKSATNIMKGHLMKCRFKFKQLFQNYYEIDDNNTKYQMSNRQMMMVLEDFKKVLNTNKHKSNTQHKKLDLIQESIRGSSSGSVKESYDKRTDNLTINL